jgi:hypothetical protein
LQLSLLLPSRPGSAGAVSKNGGTHARQNGARNDYRPGVIYILHFQQGSSKVRKRALLAARASERRRQSCLCCVNVLGFFTLGFWYALLTFFLNSSTHQASSQPASQQVAPYWQLAGWAHTLLQAIFHPPVNNALSMHKLTSRHLFVLNLSARAKEGAAGRFNGRKRNEQKSLTSFLITTLLSYRKCISSLVCT